MHFSGTRIVGSAVLAGLLCITMTLAEDAPLSPRDTIRKDERVTLAVARDRARIMHSIYAATLESMHRHYFSRERAVLPARAMEDIFAEVDRQSNIKSRWMAVNTKAMSVHHEPTTAFEKKAAEEISSGKHEFERVENGIYLRAGSITLGSSCVSCHTPFGSKVDKTPRFAALVISIPVKEDK